MATRVSARNRDKPKVDYSKADEEVVEKTRGRKVSKKSNENDPNVSNPPVKKPGRGRKAAIKTEDDSGIKDQNGAVSPPAPAKKTGRKKAKKAVKEEPEDDEEDTNDGATAAAPVKTTRGKRKAKAPTPIPDDSEMVSKKLKIEEKIGTKLKEESSKGSKIIVPVDSFCPVKSTATVYVDEDGPWDAMLNQTNVGMNNNKYYLTQLLQDSSRTYYTWFRWGRIGYNYGNQNKLTSFSSIDAAKNTFEKKFLDKTKNHWPVEYEEFEKVSGKYDLLKMDYTTKEDEVEVDGAEAVKKEPVESKLDPRLLSLMELISNVKAMESAVMEMNYDVKKSPLGKLSKEQIKSGYEALTVIEECIRAGQPGGKKAREATSMFYTRIPHSFGFSSPPMITTLEEVKLKIELLDTLIDIEAAVRAIRTGTNANSNKSDVFYKNLNIDMTPLEKDSELFQMLSDYLHNTHGKTHAHYTLEVEDIFELNRKVEKGRFKEEVGNKQLLWHGSRLTNWGGIFSQGLRIAPPEAPVTGYMFGKGVYFADMASKSANYCFTSRQQPTGVLMLAEVALGEQRELLHSDYYADKLPTGKHSTKGVGKTAPDPAQTKFIGDVKVPMGTSTDSGLGNGSLQYNEFIVYDIAQIRMKYALRVKFNYKR